MLGQYNAHIRTAYDTRNETHTQLHAHSYANKRIYNIRTHSPLTCHCTTYTHTHTSAHIHTYTHVSGSASTSVFLLYSVLHASR